MIPGHVGTFYQARRIKWAALAVLPVLVLAGVWWLVTQFVLAPRVPDGSTPPERVAQFIMHEDGLPRLKGDKGEAFLMQQIQRLAKDDAFRDRFLAEVRTSGPDEQKVFRTNLFQVFMPLLMRDVRRHNELVEPARQKFLDDCIVAYNRMNAFVGPSRMDKNAWGPAAPKSSEVMEWVMTKLTDEERRRGMAFIAALQARIEEILADPTLKAEFEARIAAP